MRNLLRFALPGLFLGLLVHDPGLAQGAAGDAEPRFRIAGDLRLRGELDRERRGAPDRERGRIRLRVMVERDLRPGLALGARLVTAPNEDDPNSTHQDLGGGFRTFRIALDRAYLRWKPDTPRPLEVWLGKFAHPFLAPPVYGELVWDADIQPEGGAIVFEPGPVRLAGGGYLLLHQGSGEDVNLGVAQAALRFGAVRDLQVTAALGVYLYGTPDETAARRLGRDNQGNALITDDRGDTLAFAADFRVVDGFLAGTYEGLQVPITGVAEYIANDSEVPGADDDGFAMGGRVGRLDRPGSWRLDYQYQNIGREATFSAQAQDDFLDAANFRGHLLGLAVRYLPNADVHLWTLWSAKEDPREDSFQKRFRIDFNFAWTHE